MDHGKIIALHKAGWKVKDIAGDMSISDVTVYNTLKKWKEGKIEATEEADTGTEKDIAE